MIYFIIFITGNKRTWIGLRYETWLNGQPFVHLFGPSTDLDNHDSEVPGDSDNTCGSLVPRTTEKWVIDNSCYIRERPFFICEMRVQCFICILTGFDGISNHVYFLGLIQGCKLVHDVWQYMTVHLGVFLYDRGSNKRCMSQQINIIQTFQNVTTLFATLLHRIKLIQ